MGSQKSQFNFDEMRNQYNNGLLKDHLDCKNYVLKYFCPLRNGTHALIEDGEVTIIQKDTMTDVYLSRFPKDIKTWYKSVTIPKQIICDISKDTVGSNFINISKTLKHKCEESEKQTEEHKKEVELLLSYIKEVWANNDDKVYVYILK